MKTRLLLLCLTVSLGGCVSFSSNIDRAQVVPFKRVLIVSKMDDYTNQRMDEFVRLFPKGYSICTANISRLSFGNPDSLVRQRVQECGSEVILTISPDPTQQTYIRSQQIIGFYLEMSRVSDGKPFWKATGPGYYGVSPRQVVDKLKDDGIISGEIPVEATARY